MLTAEIKINGETIALIEATKGEIVSDKPGDFIGDRATVCEYNCRVAGTLRRPLGHPLAEGIFTVTHDRRFGWQGLLNKITSKILPTVVETVSVEPEAE